MRNHVSVLAVGDICSRHTLLSVLPDCASQYAAGGARNVRPAAALQRNHRHQSYCISVYRIIVPSSSASTLVAGVLFLSDQFYLPYTPTSRTRSAPH